MNNSTNQPICAAEVVPFIEPPLKSNAIEILSLLEQSEL